MALKYLIGPNKLLNNNHQCPRVSHLESDLVEYRELTDEEDHLPVLVTGIDLHPA